MIFSRQRQVCNLKSAELDNRIRTLDEDVAAVINHNRHGHSAAETYAVLFSIVIPTYRRPDLLGRLLTELSSQVRLFGEDVEVVVVDNCPDLSAKPTASNFGTLARYFSESQPGIANARNRGVREAAGSHLIFIDDDQVPVPGWLSAQGKMARAGYAACFGPVIPDFEEEPPTELRNVLEQLFQRDIGAPTGSDISRFRAHLGTGNSLFDRAKCFTSGDPFDPRLVVGEDVAFIRELVQKRVVPATWCAEAAVREFVPRSRMTAAYLRRRKFRNGQLRSLIEFRGRNWGATAFWMAVGLMQSIGYAVATAIYFPIDNLRAQALSTALSGGLGKVFWWLPLRA